MGRVNTKKRILKERPAFPPFRGLQATLVPLGAFSKLAVGFANKEGTALGRQRRPISVARYSATTSPADLESG